MSFCVGCSFNRVRSGKFLVFEGRKRKLYVPTYAHHASIVVPLYPILDTLPADELAILLIRA